MGMFDRLFDEGGNEWQTKAFNCDLDSYRIGDRIGPPFAYQVEVLGGDHYRNYVDSYATVRNGLLAAVPDQRDDTLPLLNYSGHWATKEEA